MSHQSIPLRHLPAEIMAVASAIAEQTGLSLVDVYRLALGCGVLIEATKIGPDPAGTYAGLSGAYLAKALRRHLSSAIDLLLAHDEHPLSSALLTACNASPSISTDDEGKAAAHRRAPMSAHQPAEDEVPFDPTLGDDLESLGIGLGLSQQP